MNHKHLPVVYPGRTKLFEDQDFGGGMMKNEGEHLFLVAGARGTQPTATTLPVEDNSDLLK